jgi:hypothetical protein
MVAASRNLFREHSLWLAMVHPSHKVIHFTYEMLQTFQLSQWFQTFSRRGSLKLSMAEQASTIRTCQSKAPRSAAR